MQVCAILIELGWMMPVIQLVWYKAPRSPEKKKMDEECGEADVDVAEAQPLTQCVC